MVSVHHDDRWAVVLQLVHHLKGVFEGRLLLPATDPVLQVLYRRLELAVFVLVLRLPCLDGLVLLRNFLLFLG